MWPWIKILNFESEQTFGRFSPMSMILNSIYVGDDYRNDWKLNQKNGWNWYQDILMEFTREWLLISGYNRLILLKNRSLRENLNLEQTLKNLKYVRICFKTACVVFIYFNSCATNKQLFYAHQNGQTCLCKTNLQKSKAKYFIWQHGL